MSQEWNNLFEVCNRMTQGILHDEKIMQKYLVIQSRMDLYSVRNALVIAGQYPQATRLVDVSKVKKTQEKETPAIQIFNKKSSDSKQLIKYMYDVSQIEEDVPMFSKEYNSINELIIELKENSGIAIKLGNTDGYNVMFDEEEQTIFVKPLLPVEIILVDSSKAIIDYYIKDTGVDEKDSECLSNLAHFMFLNRYEYLFDKTYQKILRTNKIPEIPQHWKQLENESIIKLLNISKDMYSKMLDLSEKELRGKQKFNFTNDKKRDRER